MAQTLDQQRAAFAWACACDSRKKLPPEEAKKYRNLAKGAPALILNSGLMPTLAFYSSKAKREPTPEECLLNDLMLGLVQRLKPNPAPRDFAGFMAMLLKMESLDYRRCTDEALELLKWIRQFVDAVPNASASASTGRAA
jgi:CRISPR-associated protein Cmr5